MVIVRRFFSKLFAIFFLITILPSSVVCSMDNFCDYKVSDEVSLICEKLKPRDDIRVLLIIDHSKDCDISSAWAYFFTKIDGGNWSLSFKGKAYIGKNGLGKTREGDNKTPTGFFNINGAFGISKDPGTKLSYIKIDDTTYACDDLDSENYNKIIDVKETKHNCNGEKMLDYFPAYNYGLVIDYNRECLPFLGSNIFIHCFGKHKYTGGCIALSEKSVKDILKVVIPGKSKLVVMDSSIKVLCTDNNNE